MLYQTLLLHYIQNIYTLPHSYDGSLCGWREPSLISHLAALGTIRTCVMNLRTHMEDARRRQT